MGKRVWNVVGLMAISIYGLAYYSDIRKLPAREKMVVEYILIALAVLVAIEAGRAIIDFRKFLMEQNTDRTKFDSNAILGLSENKQVIVIVLTAIYMIIFPILGFFVTSFLYVFLLNLILGIRNKLQLVAIPAGLLVFVYILFVILFSVKLPAGILI